MSYAGDPPEWLVHRARHACAYLPEQRVNLPLRLPSRRLDRRQLSERLRQGDRRQGMLLYRPSCTSCQACEAIRVDVERYQPSRTQSRILRRGEALLETRIGAPTVTDEKVALYNRHKAERGLLVRNDFLDARDYEEFLVDTCAETLELTYYLRNRLVGVAIADRADDALSAVYCYYDPSDAALSPGTYSILKQMALCRTWGLRHLYLGLYVAGCRSMAYKARYLPHERLIGGEWRLFTGENSIPGGPRFS